MAESIRKRVIAMRIIQQQGNSSFQNLSLKDVDNMLVSLKCSEDELKKNVTAEALQAYLEHALIVSHILSDKLKMKCLSNIVFDNSALIKNTAQKILKYNQ